MNAMGWQVHEVALISDGHHHPDILKFLASRYQVRNFTPNDLEQIDPARFMFLVFDTDLSRAQIARRIRTLLADANKSKTASVFILDTESRRDIVQIFALGGSEYIVRPLMPQKLLPIFADCTNKAIEKSWETLPERQATALKLSLRAFNNMMADAARGKPLNMREIEESCHYIVDATTNDDIEKLISPLKHHHNSSFLHVIRTCGYAVAFAHLIGIRGSDLKRVAIAGLVHDIGKIYAPQNVLDKPGHLTKEEYRLIQKHSISGWEILRSSPNDHHPDILDATRQHHERLDGSGYPDGLKGMQISNLTVLISIADVFGALTEERVYREALTRQQAYKIMLGMGGQLDEGLLKTFEPLAMEETQKIGRVA